MIARERAQAIMKATLRLFARKGLAGTTTRQIARAAGVSEALLFKHFPTKDDLYRAILRAKIAEGERFLPLGHELDALGDEEFFVHIAATIMRRVALDDSFLRLWLECALAGHGLARAFHEARIEKLRDVVAARVRRIYARIHSRNRRGPIDARDAAFVWSGHVMSAILARQIFRDPHVRRLSVERHARLLATQFLGGLGVPAAAP